MTSPAESTERGGEGERGSVGDENQPPPDDTTASSGVCFPSASIELSADGDLSVECGYSSLSDDGVPVPTTAPTTTRQLESSLVGSGQSEELGSTRSHMRALNREVVGIVTVLGPDEGG